MADIKEKIKQEFQTHLRVMKEGCGRERCHRPYCAANPVFIKPQNIKVKALQLVKSGYKPCEVILFVPSMQLKQVTGSKLNAQRIFQVFRNEQALKVSFVPGNSIQLFASPDNPLFDNKAADLLLSQIIVDDQAQQKINLGIKQLCDKLKFKDFTQLPDLRTFFVLLFFVPKLKLDFPVPKLIYLQLSRLSEHTLKNFIGWLQVFSEDQLGRVVDLFNNQVSININLLRINLKDEIRIPLNILKQLFLLNEKFKKLPVSRFYNQVISSLPQENVMERYLQMQGQDTINFVDYHFLMDVVLKSKLLKIQSMIESHKAQRQVLVENDGRGIPFLLCIVSRDRLIDDALIFAHQNKNFKSPLKVVFKGQKGVDQGGVRKEFFSLASQALFDVGFGMFNLCAQGRELWINSNTFEPPIKFELVGILLGLAIYNSINIEVNLSPLLFKKLFGVQLGLSDLRFFDQQLYSQLTKLLQIEIDQDDLQTTFTTIQDVFGDMRTIPLVQNGQAIKVNNKNKHEYVRALVDWKFNKSIDKQFNAFRKGFFMVLTGQIIKIFHPSEIEELIQGCSFLDFKQLQQSTNYQGYQQDSPYIKGFWQIANQMSEQQKKKFLFFCTGGQRAPLGGLGNLNFVIQRQGGDTDKLPCASTCFNILLLPQYFSKAKLKQKLLKAIQNSQGFGLL